MKGGGGRGGERTVPFLFSLSGTKLIVSIKTDWYTLQPEEKRGIAVARRKKDQKSPQGAIQGEDKGTVPTDAQSQEGEPGLDTDSHQLKVGRRCAQSSYSAMIPKTLLNTGWTLILLMLLTPSADGNHLSLMFMFLISVITGKK